MAKVPSPARVYIEGRVVDAQEARVSVFDRGFLYGDSIYEVTRTVGGWPLFLAEHLRRLELSARGLEMALPPRDRIEAAIAETLAALAPFDGGRAYLRIVVTRGAGELSLDPAMADEPQLVLIAKPLAPPDVRLYTEGAALTVVDWRRNAPGHVPAVVKSGNYLSSVMATLAAKRRNAYEALLLDIDGRLAEGASSNFFWIQERCLHTPPVSLGILPGITRDVVLGLAQEAGLAVQEAAEPPQVLRHADEALLTSSVRGIVPAVRVDDTVIGDGRPGPFTRGLMDLYGERIGEPPPR